MPAFTRRHYVEVARILHDVRDRYERQRLAEEFARMFREDNPQFDAERFSSAVFGAYQSAPQTRAKRQGEAREQSHHTSPSIRYELITYDVWGNEQDGFEVNQAFSTGQFVDIPEEASNDAIVSILKREGMIDDDVPLRDIGIEGESGYSLYFTHTPTARPEFELRAVKR